MVDKWWKWWYNTNNIEIDTFLDFYKHIYYYTKLGIEENTLSLVNIFCYGSVRDIFCVVNNSKRGIL